MSEHEKKPHPGHPDTPNQPIPTAYDAPAPGDDGPPPDGPGGGTGQ